MEEKILLKIDELSNSMIDDIIKIVKIDSTEQESTLDSPFGDGVREALETALNISKNLGFSTKNLDNYIGYAQYGEGDEYVCAIGHLDVVPVGEGWKNPPFSAHIEADTIYSRGILDNKGPIISCLYAMYAIKELNIKPKLPIRVIFGCDEETGFKDLDYYLQKEKPPVMGFTPDCKYPVVYAETGRATLTISSNINNIKEFFDFVNTYFLNSKNNGEKLGIGFEDKEYGTLQLRNYTLQESENELKFIAYISYPYGIDCDSILQKLGIGFEDKEYGTLQLRNYTLQESENELKFIAYISYPYGIDCDSILQKVNKETCKFKGIKANILNRFLPVRFSKNSLLIKSLQQAYEKVTGEDGSPVTTSGGTYAKMMPNIVPFGPSFPGQKDISHNPNEWMKISDIILLQQAYEKVTGEDGSPVTTSGGTYAKMMPNIVPFGPSFPGQKDISHNPNEWMKISDIILNAKIFALGLYYLATNDSI